MRFYIPIHPLSSQGVVSKVGPFIITFLATGIESLVSLRIGYICLFLTLRSTQSPSLPHRKGDFSYLRYLTLQPSTHGNPPSDPFFLSLPLLLPRPFALSCSALGTLTSFGVTVLWMREREWRRRRRRRREEREKRRKKEGK